MKKRKTYQEEICQETQGGSQDRTNNLARVGDAPVHISEAALQGLDIPETFFFRGLGCCVGEVLTKMGAQRWHLGGDRYVMR